MKRYILEVHAQSYLFAPPQVDHAPRLSKARIPLGRDEVRQAAVVVEVEGVEDLRDQPHRGVAEDAEILAQTEVNVAVGKAPRLRRADRIPEWLRFQPVRQAEALREVEDVRRPAGAERQDAAEHDVVRQSVHA